MASILASCEAIWLRKLLIEFFGLDMGPTLIHFDNKSCIKLSENLVSHNRSKHIKINNHFMRDRVQRDVVSL